MLKKIVNIFWFDGESKDFSLKKDVDFSFSLSYKDLHVGTLSYYDDEWHYAYSEDFKSQKSLLPLVNFPHIDKEYISSQLWSFFASRIPSAAQRQVADDTKDDIYELLIKYGKKVVSNPYELKPLLQ